jgi:hypothetical protein
LRRFFDRDLPPERDEKGPLEDERDDEEEDLRRAMEIVNFTGYSGSCQREEGEGETWGRGVVEQWRSGVMNPSIRESFGKPPFHLLLRWRIPFANAGLGATVFR